jgi:dihydroxyacid dehydratase/phosphogluconate dehydratase
MSSSVVKLAGMTDRQLTHFDDHIFIVVYFEHERACLDQMSSVKIFDDLLALIEKMPQEVISKFLEYNSKGEVTKFVKDDFTSLLKKGYLSFAFVIAGQGPRAYGMPEMFAPGQNLKHHTLLEASSLLITDGRYSGVTKGACIGHVTPEAFDGGGIGKLDNGDLMWLRISKKHLDIIDPQCLVTGEVVPYNCLPERSDTVAKRMAMMQDRVLDIAACNLMYDVSSSEKGCVPYPVDQRATSPL